MTFAAPVERADPRDDPRHVLPDPFPAELRRYDTPVPLLGAGRPGKLGLLELDFAPRQGVTRLVRHYQRTPLQVLRSLYYDPARPDIAYVMLIQTGGGMVQGDRYRIDVAAAPGAAVHLTTQAASKLYRCDENFVTQVITLTAGPDSLIEYLPDVTIPYRGARFYQHTILRLDPTAIVIIGDILAAGRSAFGEHHAYDLFLTRLDAYDGDGTLLVSDTVKLEPALSPPAGLALLGPYPVFGVLAVFARQVTPAALVTGLRQALAADPACQETISGVSELPHGCGASVRILGPSTAAVERARHVAWDAARRALLGAPAPDLRKP